MLSCREAGISLIDLHIHTTVSDGTLTPEQVAVESARLGLRVIAITDHDITDGIPLAAPAARELGLELVPGVEINTDFGETDLHLLGYFIDLEYPELQDQLDRIRTARLERNRKILSKLAALGLLVAEERVLAMAGPGSVGRPHIGEAMVEAGHVESVKQAFEQYLARGKPAFVDRYRFSPIEAIQLIKRAGGLACLAHPAKVRDDQLVMELASHGLDALEAYHYDHTAVQTDHYRRMAEQLGLLVTGGTDSHGPDSDRPVPIGGTPVPYQVWGPLLSAYQQTRASSAAG